MLHLPAAPAARDDPPDPPAWPPRSPAWPPPSAPAPAATSSTPTSIAPSIWSTASDPPWTASAAHQPSLLPLRPPHLRPLRESTALVPCDDAPWHSPLAGLHDPPLARRSHLRSSSLGWSPAAPRAAAAALPPIEHRHSHLSTPPLSSSSSSSPSFALSNSCAATTTHVLASAAIALGPAASNVAAAAAAASSSALPSSTSLAAASVAAVAAAAAAAAVPTPWDTPISRPLSAASLAAPPPSTAYADLLHPLPGLARPSSQKRSSLSLADFPHFTLDLAASRELLPDWSRASSTSPILPLSTTTASSSALGPSMYTQQQQQQQQPFRDHPQTGFARSHIQLAHPHPQQPLSQQQQQMHLHMQLQMQQQQQQQQQQIQIQQMQTQYSLQQSLSSQDSTQVIGLRRARSAAVLSDLPSQIPSYSTQPSQSHQHPSLHQLPSQSNASVVTPDISNPRFPLPSQSLVTERPQYPGKAVLDEHLYQQQPHRQQQYQHPRHTDSSGSAHLSMYSTQMTPYHLHSQHHPQSQHPLHQQQQQPSLQYQQMQHQQHPSYQFQHGTRTATGGRAFLRPGDDPGRFHIDPTNRYDAGANPAAAMRRRRSRQFKDTSSSLDTPPTLAPSLPDTNKPIGIVLRGLPDSVKIVDLIDIFSPFGEISNVGIDNRKKCAFVDFEQPSSAVTALNNIQSFRHPVLSDAAGVDMALRYDKPAPVSIDDVNIGRLPMQQQPQQQQTQHHYMLQKQQQQQLQQQQQQLQLQLPQGMHPHPAMRRHASADIHLENEASSTIHITNCPHNITRPELEASFARLGEFKKIRIVQRPSDRRASAYITFQSPEMAYKAADVSVLQRLPIFHDMRDPLHIELPSRDTTSRQRDMHAAFDSSTRRLDVAHEHERSISNTSVGSPAAGGGGHYHHHHHHHHHHPPSSATVTVTGAIISKRAKKTAAAENRIVYVRQVALEHTTIQSLISVFDPSCGRVLSAHILPKPDPSLPPSAFIVFDTPHSAATAISAKIGGCTLPRHKRIDLPNIPYNITLHHITDYLGSVAEIKQIVLPPDYDIGSSVSTAMVEFVTAMGAAKAIVWCRERVPRFGSDVVLADYASSMKKGDGCDAVGSGGESGSVVGVGVSTSGVAAAAFVAVTTAEYRQKVAYDDDNVVSLSDFASMWSSTTNTLATTNTTTACTETDVVKPMGVTVTNHAAVASTSTPSSTSITSVCHHDRDSESDPVSRVDVRVESGATVAASLDIPADGGSNTTTMALPPQLYDHENNVDETVVSLHGLSIH